MPRDSDPRIRRAAPGEADRLSALALDSKAHWGYSRNFMDACRNELTLSGSYVRDHPTFVLESQRTLLGFYSLEHLSNREVELAHLFVDSGAIGRGHGRMLIDHAKSYASGLGYTTMVIQGDPHAARFYRSAGSRCVGSRESASIPGRELPLFEIDLRSSEAVDA